MLKHAKRPKYPPLASTQQRSLALREWPRRRSEPSGRCAAGSANAAARFVAGRCALHLERVARAVNSFVGTLERKQMRRPPTWAEVRFPVRLNGLQESFDSLCKFGTSSSLQLDEVSMLRRTYGLWVFEGLCLVRPTNLCALAGLLKTAKQVLERLGYTTSNRCLWMVTGLRQAPFRPSIGI